MSRKDKLYEEYQQYVKDSPNNGLGFFDYLVLRIEQLENPIVVSEIEVKREMTTAIKTPYFIQGEINPRCPDCLSAMREIFQRGLISYYVCNDCGRKWEKDYNEKGGDNHAHSPEEQSKAKE